MTEPILQGLHVLVVDDDRLVSSAISRMLRGLGASEVYQAGSLDAALGTVACAHLDLVLVDLAIGHTSGVTVLAALREARPALAALLITGSEPDRLPAGTELLRKPFTFRELAKAAARQLGAATCREAI